MPRIAASERDAFYELLRSYSFRLFLRDILVLRDRYLPERLGPFFSQQAYDLAMKARHLLLSDSDEDDLEARRLFEQAATLDPNYVEAHLGIATTFVRSAATGTAPPARPDGARASRSNAS